MTLLEQYEILDDGTVEVKPVCSAWDGAMQMYAEEAAEKARKETAREVTRKVTRKVTRRVTKNVKRKTEERFSKLNLLLIGEKRYEDLERASRDKEYRYRLFADYNL